MMVKNGIAEGYARAIEEAAQTLDNEAARLRTPAGRIAAQWHEHDAEMVARELDRRARAIRSLKENPNAN